MQIFLLILFGLIAFFWLAHGLRVLIGAMQLPQVQEFAAAADENCPRISILFAARDEEEKLSAALETLLTLDYPNFEIIAVDDRSTDATPKILAENKAQDSRLQVVRVDELPSGWLGKPHALQKGYEVSSGELLLFTDADVQFKPDTLRRVVTLFQQKQLDHLTLLCGLDMRGFWEKVALTFFGLVFQLSTDPKSVGNPKSRGYVGIGAFQLVKRQVYELAGTHKKLAMEIVDDLKLAKIMKQAGAKSCVGVANEHVSLRWHAGIRNIVRGVTKNFFAAAGYSLFMVTAHCLIIVLVSLLPFLAVAFLHGWARGFAIFSIVIAIWFQSSVAFILKANPFYGLTHPIGCVVYLYMVLRSTVVTLWRGGVTWRDTFYSLEELRRRKV